MFVRDFYSQAKTQFANCDEDTVLARLTDAVRLLNNKGIDDVNLGGMDICLCNGCASLPRDVGTVLGINVGGQPTLIRDQWYQYHINGGGSTDCTSCNFSDELGEFCTYRDPSGPCYLQAEVTSSKDNNKKLRVFALDASGNKIFSSAPGGVLQEGFLVPLVYGFSNRNPNIPAISSIYRISKEMTHDYVRLIAVDASTGLSMTKIGEYEPSETLPSYRRIRVPNKSWVRIKYKKKDLKLTSQSDFINLDNDEVLRLACRAVKFRLDDQYDKARAAEEEATRIWNEQIESKRPSGPREPQIINGVFNSNGDGLIYGSCDGGFYGGPY